MSLSSAYDELDQQVVDAAGGIPFPFQGSRQLAQVL